MTEIVVKLADVKWAAPGENMVTYSLGSCVGIAIWDRATKHGGMAHCLLSTPRVFTQGGERPDERSQGVLGKYVQVAVPALIRGLIERGSSREDLVACLAGGAEMFESPACHLGDIGAQNVKAAKRALAEEGLVLAGEDVGGGHGRTMRLFTDTGRVTVASIGHAQVELWMAELLSKARGVDCGGEGLVRRRRAVYEDKGGETSCRPRVRGL